jgi:hypothetical protein
MVSFVLSIAQKAAEAVRKSTIGKPMKITNSTTRIFFVVLFIFGSEKLLPEWCRLCHEIQPTPD